MTEKYNVYLISDSTGETLDRIFLSLKSQFANFDYDKKEFVFVRTEQQIDKIISEGASIKNCIILYTIVETRLAKYISKKSEEKNIPCFGILGNLILTFSKLLNQKASHKPSAQHVLDEDYYKRIEAIQFTMSHDDGKKTDDISQADIVLLGVSRTSKTPTAIYLAKMLTSKSLPEIGRSFSNRDHTTVIHSVKTIERLRQEDKELNSNIDSLKNKILYNKENEI